MSALLKMVISVIVAIGQIKVSHIYPMCGIVTDTDHITDTVTITDYNGNQWDFYGVEDWENGDICAAVMHNNGTPWVYDDIIVRVRYCG